jgi:phosphatidylglycerophosphate synthase
VTPNHLAAVGALAALGAGAALARSSFGSGWLWAASAFLAVNWFGDSLDGTLARVRRIERPRYGYYLDHITDAFASAAVGLGIGLSPYVSFSAATLVVLGYLALSINVYLEAGVFDLFRLGYGRIGPTEVRIILVIANAALAVGYAAGFPAVAGNLKLPDALAIAAAAGMLAILAARVARNLARLAALEPRPATAGPQEG